MPPLAPLSCIAGKAVSARSLSHYGVVLTTYQTMALESPCREGPAGGSKKQASPGAADAAAAPGGVPAGVPGGGAAWEQEVVDLLSDSEEDEQPAAAAAAAQQPATKRQKAAAGKAAAGSGRGQGRVGPLYEIMWHRHVGWGWARSGLLVGRWRVARAPCWALPRPAERFWVLFSTVLSRLCRVPCHPMLPPSPLLAWPCHPLQGGAG